MTDYRGFNNDQMVCQSTKMHLSKLGQRQGLRKSFLARTPLIKTYARLFRNEDEFTIFLSVFLSQTEKILLKTPP